MEIHTKIAVVLHHSRHLGFSTRGTQRYIYETHLLVEQNVRIYGTKKTFTPPKTNMDTQNDAIFAAGDIYILKTIILSIYVRFRGVRFS